MKTLVSNELYISNPTPYALAIIKSREVDNPEYKSKMRMGKWIGNTPKKIRLWRQDGDTYIIPFGCLDNLASEIVSHKYDTDFAENLPNTMQGSIELYDYQKEAVDRLQRCRNGILIAPAGSGKTQMALALIQRIGKKTLWLTHTKDLLNQSKLRAERYFTGDFGTITEGAVHIGRDITFATVQTLAKQDITRFKYSFDCVIVDECHRIAATAGSVGMFEKVLNAMAARYKYGITATLHRADGLQDCIPWMLGGVAHEVPKSAVADKIMPVSVTRVDTGTPESFVYLGTDGMMDYSKLIAYLCENDRRNKVISGYLNINSGHSNLILSDRLEHLETLMSMVEHQELCCMVSGRMTSKAGKAEREQAIKDMQSGKKKYLFATFGLAKEGLDIPCLDRLYLTVPKKDYSVVVQSLGRIARTSPEKSIPICYDFVDDIPYCISQKKKRNTIYKKLGYQFER